MFLTQSIAQLKAYCEQNAIVVEGDKRKKATWLAAIEIFQSAVEVAEEIVSKCQDPEEFVSAVIEFAQRANGILLKFAETAKAIAVKASEIATSGEAIELYRRIAYVASLVIVLVACAVISIGRTILESEMAQSAIDSVQVKAVEFMESVKLRSDEFGARLRSKFSNEYQSLLSLASFAYLDLME